MTTNLIDLIAQQKFKNNVKLHSMTASVYKQILFVYMLQDL